MIPWRRLSDEAEFLGAHMRDIPVVQPVTPSEMRAELERLFDFRVPMPLAELTELTIDRLRHRNVHVTHPRYFGLFNPSVREAAIVGDTLAAMFNPQLAAWSHSPVVNELEQLVLRYLATLLGWDPRTTAASFTSGGAEANLSALVTAVAHRFPDTVTSGLRGLPASPAIYASGECHHSIAKAARLVGLGAGAVREVAVDRRYAVDPADLERRLADDRRAGWLPLMIVGTAGTTSAGVVDPLGDLAALARRCGAWFHVDAAWGASAAFSPKLRPLLDGIEHADSVTWDAHKWLSVPMGAGMYFCRHRQAVAATFGQRTSYMPAGPGDETLDPYASTIQWSRRATGLKVFMALAELGADGYRELIEHQTAMGDLLRDELVRSGWRIVNDTPLPLVCFTNDRIDGGQCDTRAILEWIYARGNVWISDVRLGGTQPALRACVTSFRTGPDDIRFLVREVDQAVEPE